MSKTPNPDQLPKVPWTHFWSVDALSNGRVVASITLPADMNQDMAKFLDLLSIQSLACKFEISRKGGQHIIHVAGTITASLEQTCVQSLEAVPTKIEETFDSYFADRDQAVPFSQAKKELFSKYGVDDMPILDEEEDPEAVIDGQIDLAALATQYLSLALDPYPRKEGLEVPYQEPEPEKSEDPTNPFAALKDWNKGE